MNIAILSFGAAFAETLHGRQVRFSCGGPKLPLEFSRIKPNGGLDLVIDTINGAENVIFYSPVQADDIESIVKNINSKNVGWLDVKNTTCNERSARRPSVIKTIDQWCRDRNFDGAVWFDAGPRFNKITRVKFTPENARTYLNQGRFEQTYHYMQKFPISIKTPLRSLIVDGENFEIIDGI